MVLSRARRNEIVAPHLLPNTAPASAGVMTQGIFLAGSSFVLAMTKNDFAHSSLSEMFRQNFLSAISFVPLRERVRG